MQDLRSMVANGGGGGGRIFGTERRLRPFPNQALKCPRCDSLNTKFCYYNNYNLSQPRHFCKSCRRYWTKGGVLRNVPVGGGCRKTKRSKPKSSSPDLQKEKKSNSHSSSDSSSLTATTNEAASSSSAAALLNFTTDDSALVSQSTNPNSTFEPSSMIQQLNNLDQASDTGIFHEPGSFTSLMTTSSNHHPGYLGFNLSDISPFRLHHHHHQQQQQQEQQQEQQQQQQQQQQIELEQQKMTSIVDELKLQFDSKNDHELKLQELTKGFYDQTVPGEMPGLPNRTTTDNGDQLTGLDWQSSSDHQGLMFDLPTSVDQSYWSQSSQWTDSDHPLYLP